MEAIKSISNTNAMAVSISGSSAPSVQVSQPKIQPQAVVVQSVPVQSVPVQSVPVQSIPVESVPTQAQPEPMVNEQELKQAIQQANQSFAGSNESVSFMYEEKLGQLFVQITDSQSGEVIREVPSKEFIQHQVAMKELVGLLLDKQA